MVFGLLIDLDNRQDFEAQPTERTFHILGNNRVGHVILEGKKENIEEGQFEDNERDEKVSCQDSMKMTRRTHARG